MDRLERLPWLNNRNRIILSTALDFCEMWDLPHPVHAQLLKEKRRSIRHFWWRSWHSAACINSLPNKRWRDIEPEKYDTPASDRLACMSAICGSLNARHFTPYHICALLDFSPAVFYDSLKRWRAESIEYRFMVCAMKGDLAHKALRNFVLGLPGAC